jgi:hypothetical protein
LLIVWILSLKPQIRLLLQQVVEVGAQAAAVHQVEGEEEVVVEAGKTLSGATILLS